MAYYDTQALQAYIMQRAQIMGLTQMSPFVSIRPKAAVGKLGNRGLKRSNPMAELLKSLLMGLGNSLSVEKALATPRVWATNL